MCVCVCVCVCVCMYKCMYMNMYICVGPLKVLLVRCNPVLSVS